MKNNAIKAGAFLLSLCLTVSIFGGGVTANAVTPDSELITEQTEEDEILLPVFEEEQIDYEIVSDYEFEGVSADIVVDQVSDYEAEGYINQQIEIKEATEITNDESTSPYINKLGMYWYSDTYLPNDSGGVEYIDYSYLLPVNDYSSETGNEYSVVFPDNIRRNYYPCIFSTLSGVSSEDNTYFCVYHGSTKETATTQVKAPELVSNYHQDSMFVLWYLENSFVIGSEHWIKYVVGIGPELEEAQTFFIRCTCGPSLKSVTATDQNSNVLRVRQKGNTIFLTYTGEKLYISLEPYNPEIGELFLAGTAIKNSEINEIDLLQFAEDEHGARRIPITVKYTGEGIGSDFEYTLIIDPNDYAPQIQPFSENPVYCKQKEAVALQVDASVTRGEISYQWYRAVGNKFAAVDGATEAIFYTSTDNSGSYQHIVRVFNNVDGFLFYTDSEILFVIIEATEASEANIISVSPDTTVIQGTNQTVNINAEPKDQGAVLSYQWFVNDENNNISGMPIEDSNTSSVSVDSSQPGEKYYYCNVTSTIKLPDGSFSSNSDAVSDTIKVTVLSTNDLFKGLGTEEDPFLLTGPSDFTTLRTLVNESNNPLVGLHFKLTKNVTLPSNWEPLGHTKDGTTNLKNGENLVPFSGSIDGSGFQITIRNGKQPLLGYVKDAEVKNLIIYGKQIEGYGLVNNYEGIGLSGSAITIDNVTLKSGSQILKSGLIGGNITVNSLAAASAGYYVTIRNCTVEEGVVIGYDGTQSQIGSIAGRINGTIDNCTSAATVKGVNYVGGIVGTMDNATGGLVVSNCQFTGSVDASGEAVGGIVGGGYKHATAPNAFGVSITGCSSSGTVTGAKNIGGILGAEDGIDQNWAPANVSGNTFTGTVSGSENVGGIIGIYRALNKNSSIANNYFDPECGATTGAGRVVHVDTSGVEFGSKDGVFYYNTANYDAYSADDWAQIYAAVDADWAGSGRFTNSSISKKDMNRTDDPLGADADKLWKAGIPTDAYVTEIQISGAYKAEYLLNEEFDPEGIVITVLYSDGTTKEITSENEEFRDVEFSGFDSETLGEKTVTVTYMGISASFSVTVKAPEGETITVKLSILGDTLHEGEDVVHTLAAGNLIPWVEETPFVVGCNATVWDLLLQAFEANGITFEYRMSLGTEYIYSVTYNGVTLTEKDNNPNSGWMYTINGKDSDKGVNQQYLAEGDVICFHWTDDYTQEDYGDDDMAVYAVIDMIDALPDPEELTLEDEEAVKAAREAYDALTDEQKEKVGQEYIDKLEAVEAALEELKAAGKVKVTSVSLTLKGKIGIYIYAQMPEGAATAKLTYPKTTEVKEYKLDKNKSYYIEDTDTYKFLYENVPAKELTQPLELEVFDAEGKALPITHVRLGDYGTKFSCKAVDYCNTILANPDQPEKLKDLVKAILNYGQCAQIQFEFDMDNLANPEGYMAEEMKTVQADPANDPEIPSNAADVGWAYGTLSLKGAINANLYFDKEITATDENGKAYKVTAKSNGKYVITVENIPAKNLGDKFTVKASCGGKTATIKYSALSYTNAVLRSDTQPDTLKELCKAIILYNQYATAFFNK